MSSTNDRHNLFQRSSTSDQLNLLQSLVDSRDLTPDHAFALLNLIRKDLDHSGGGVASIYRRYGEVMDSFHRQMPEIYDEVASTWQQKRQGSLPAARSLLQEPAQAGSEAAGGSASEAMVEEPGGIVERHADVEHETTAHTEPQEPHEEVRETEEGHADPEEQEQEKEEGEKEEVEEPEEESEGEKSEVKSEEEEEEVEEPKEEGGGGLEEKEEENTEESEGEKEGVEEPEAETEAEPENAGTEEVEPEALEESEAEASLESLAAESSEESEAEGDHMATEAAEAAEHFESGEAESEGTEPPEIEEEPPVEGGED